MDVSLILAMAALGLAARLRGWLARPAVRFAFGGTVLGFGAWGSPTRAGCGKHFSVYRRQA